MKITKIIVCKTYLIGTAIACFEAFVIIIIIIIIIITIIIIIIIIIIVIIIIIIIIIIITSYTGKSKYNYFTLYIDRLEFKR